jgi:hypothetical protein
MIRYHLAAMISLPACLLTGCALDTSEPPAPGGAADESAALAHPHCVVRLPENEEACFGNFRDAISAATNGEILDAPLDASLAAVDPEFTARIDGLALRGIAPALGPPGIVPADVIGPANGSVLGILYWDASFVSFTRVYTAARGCDSNKNTVDWGVSNVGSTWNDQISSFQSFTGCATVLFTDDNFNGPRTQLATSMKNLGIMNDRATSIQWF